MDSEPLAGEPLTCAECGASLPAGVEVCDRCSPPAPTTIRAAEPVEALLRRAKGQLLVGAMFLPVLFAPLALQNVMKAERALRQSPVPDAGLTASARRLRIAATTAIILVYGIVALIAWSQYAEGRNGF